MIKTFDILTSFPLFKGLSYESLFDFVARTPLDFKRVESGMTVIKQGEKCQGLIGLVNGKLRIEKLFAGKRIRLLEDFGPGTMIGFEYLFGQSPIYPFDIRAIEECGIIKFSKESCMSLMLKEVVCFLNYQNFICTKAQRKDMIPEINGVSCEESFIDFLISNVFNNTFSETIHIIGECPDLKKLLAGVDDRVKKIPGFIGETKWLSETHLLLNKLYPNESF